jgi:hypothetical protein
MNRFGRRSLATMLAVCTCALPAFAQFPTAEQYSHGKTITEKFDRFKGSSAVDLKSSPSGIANIDLGAFFVYAGERLSEAPRFVSMMFVSSSSSWKFLQSHDVTFLLDGKPMSPAKRSEQDGRVGQGYVLEFISQTLTMDEFLHVANAKTVEAQIGTTEGAFSPEIVAALRDLASRANPQRPPRPTAGIAAAPAISEELKPQEIGPIEGWLVSVTQCHRAGNDTRCSASIKNTGSERFGYRLENVHVLDGARESDAKDFNYSPKAGYGMEGKQGSCEPSAACMVEFSYETRAATRMRFAFSVWGASWAGGKIKESGTVELALPAAR